MHSAHRFKNIIFDIGKVIIDIDTTRRPVFEAFSRLSEKYGCFKTADEIESVFDEAETNEKLIDYHRGKISSSEFRALIKHKLNLHAITDDEFDEAWDASILAAPETVKARLGYILELKQQGFKTFVLSNQI